MSEDQQTIRIFISSPGDVTDERDGARRVIEGLRRHYPGADLQAVLWEELALPATATFQETIDILLEQEPIDIAVFILWSRLGSPLGPAVTRPDGTPYRSGTEREFDLMLTAFEQSGRKRPVILAYVRDDDAGFKRKLAESPKSDLPELIDQQQLAEAFIVEQFHDSEGRNLRAYQTYREPVGFTQRLRVHLRRAIDDLLDVDSAATWTEEPYRGLEVFDVQHAPIFHGRDEETCDLLQRLRDQQQAGCAFVVIVAASGSGKSSLARAGVAANLVQQADADDGAKWKVLSLIPALADQSLCHALVRSLAEVLPELTDSDDAANNLAEGLAENAALTVKLTIAPALARTSQPVRLLLILDQMEELWTDRHTTERDRETFLAAIEALARSGHISVLATLRSDFYHHAQASPTFLRLKGERGHFDLSPPDAGSIHRLITEPARLSGLKFEQNEQTGRSLDEVILEDAAHDPNALPLLEYTLSELYRQRDEERRLMTYGAYVELGGVEGAIGKRAEETFAALSSDAQDALDEILPLLVSVDVAGEQAAVRRRASVAELTATAARKTLTETLIAARFLTTDREGETPIASLAHEALLRRWDRIVDWISANREQLRLRARVEQNQQRWEQQDRDDSLFLAEGLPLDEGRQLLDEAPYLLTERTTEYIRASIDHHEQRAFRNRRLKQAIIAGFVAILTVMTVGGFLMRRTRQHEVTESLVTAVTTARGIAFPPTVDDLDDLPREMVVKALAERFDTAEGSAKLSLAFALARYDDVRREFLLSRIKDARPDELENFVDAFSWNIKEEVLEAIKEVASSLGGASEAALRHKARLSMLSLHLGDPSLATEMCQLRSDPFQRTVFIDECSSWCGDLLRLSKLTAEIDDAATRSALCLVVGGVSPDEVTAEQRKAWQALLVDWHRSQLDTGTHSASSWALRQWGLPARELPVSVEEQSKENDSINLPQAWRVNSVGLTMLRIPAGRVVSDKGETVEVTEDFLLSDREISVRLFQQFMNDPAAEKPKDRPGVDQRVSPTAEHPAQRVNWYDAVMFCNWLSGKEGLASCYQRTGDKEKDFQGKEHDAWRLDPTANGYRLPTAVEWEYACRAGTTTTYSFADDARWLDAYGVYRTDLAEPCGTKLPNGWGLFDMHGNVEEWCNDAEGSFRVIRGGSWYGPAGICRSSIRSRSVPSGRSNGLGFRVAAVPFKQSTSKNSESRQTDQAEAEP